MSNKWAELHGYHYDHSEREHLSSIGMPIYDNNDIIDDDGDLEQMEEERRNMNIIAICFSVFIVVLFILM